MNKKVKIGLIAFAALDLVAEVAGTIIVRRKIKEIYRDKVNLNDQLLSEQQTNLRLATDLAKIRAERDKYKKQYGELKED